jgi:hypothetical protein
MAQLQISGEQMLRKQLESEKCTDIQTVRLAGQGQVMVAKTEEGDWRAIRIRDGWEFQKQEIVNSAVAQRRQGPRTFREEAEGEAPKEEKEKPRSFQQEASAAEAHAEEQQAAPREQAEEGMHAGMLAFGYRVNAGGMEQATHAVNNNLDAIMNSTDPKVQALIGFDGMMDRFGVRAGGGISISINLDMLREKGFEINEEQVGRDLQQNPVAVLSHFLSLGIPEAVEIRQTGAAAGGMRPAGTQMEISEFTQFVSMLDTARKFAQEHQEDNTRVAAMGNISGHAVA